MQKLTRGDETIHAPTGFSFTTMCFGFFPVLLRGDFNLACVLFFTFLCSFVPIAGLLLFPAFFIAPAVINRIFIARLQSKGFEGGEKAKLNVFPLQKGELRNSLWAFVGFIASSVIFIVALYVLVAGVFYGDMPDSLWPMDIYYHYTL